MSNSNQSGGGDFGYWLLTVIAFIAFWPLGLVLLFRASFQRSIYLYTVLPVFLCILTEPPVYVKTYVPYPGRYCLIYVVPQLLKIRGQGIQLFSGAVLTLPADKLALSEKDKGEQHHRDDEEYEHDDV